MELLAQAGALSLRRYDGERTKHEHPHHHVVLGVSGTMELELPGGSGRADVAQAAVVVAGTEHAFHTSKGTSCVVVDVPQRAAETLAARGVLAAEKRPFITVDQGLFHLIRFAEHELKRHPTGRVSADELTWSSSLTGTLLMALFDRVLSHERPVGPQLARAVAHIERHLDAPLTTSELARTAGCSKTVLNALFRAAHDTTPMAYVTQRRLATARRELAGTHLTIAEIALRCGFSEQSALTRAMKRELGVTPAAYRRDIGPRARAESDAKRGHEPERPPQRARQSERRARGR